MNKKIEVICARIDATEYAAVVRLVGQRMADTGVKRGRGLSEYVRDAVREKVARDTKSK